MDEINAKAPTAVVEKEYIISSADIDIIANQYDISIDNIKTLLMKHRGDLYKTAADAYTVYMGNQNVLYESPIYMLEKNNDTLGVEDETDPKIKLEKFDYIIREKNRIYQEYIKRQYDPSDEVYHFIKLPMNPTAIVKEKKNAKKTEFVNKFIVNYIEDEMPLRLYETNEILKFKITDADFVSKWSLEDAYIFFIKPQIRDTNDINGEQYIKYKNKLATRILKSTLKSGEIVIGGAIIVYNWK